MSPWRRSGSSGISQEVTTTHYGAVSQDRRGILLFYSPHRDRSVSRRRSSCLTFDHTCSVRAFLSAGSRGGRCFSFHRLIPCLMIDRTNSGRTWRAIWRRELVVRRLFIIRLLGNRVELCTVSVSDVLTGSRPRKDNTSCIIASGSRWKSSNKNTRT